MTETLHTFAHLIHLFLERRALRNPQASNESNPTSTKKKKTKQSEIILTPA